MALKLAPNKKSAHAAFGGDSKPYPVAYVQGGDLEGQKLWVDADAHSGDRRIDLPIDSHFTIEPPADPEHRQCLWCFGMSGSGKSTTLKRYAERYRELWPRRTIVLISQLNEDSTLDAVAAKLKMHRLPIASLVERPLQLEELGDEGCLVLFDVIDALATKEEDAAVYNAMMVIATMGRHAKCSMLVASHAPTNGLKTRVLLNEMHGVVCYPHGASPMQVEYLLTRYCGMSKEQVKAARQLRSRWFMCNKTYPSHLLADGCAYLLHGDSE